MLRWRTLPSIEPVEDQLKVSEDGAMQWFSLVPEFKTANSYTSHLKTACALAKESIAWDTPTVPALVKAKLKQDRSDVKRTK